MIVGGGAAGIGAAGAAKAVDKATEVVVYTEFEDAAYSPCGIPYVHGKEIPDFERLFLASKEAYVEAGHRHPLRDRGDRGRHRREEGHGRRARATSATTAWSIATGFDYADPGVPGTDLEGIYYVKNIRARHASGTRSSTRSKSAVVIEA